MIVPTEPRPSRSVIPIFFCDLAYGSVQAGAIEAVASTGGQLMPPIMGAAAFLMAEFLEIPYTEVVLAALIPAILYYVALFILADLEAGRAGIEPMDPKDIPKLWPILKDGWYFPVPFVVLIGALFFWNFSPELSAILAAFSIIATGMIFGYKGKRLTPRDIVEAVRDTLGADQFLANVTQERVGGIESRVIVPLGGDTACFGKLREDAGGKCQAKHRCRHAGIYLPPATLSPFGAADDFVERQVEQSGNDLGQGPPGPIALVARVGRQRFLDLFLKLAVRANSAEQRFRKAIIIGVSRFAADDHRDDPLTAAHRFESAYLFVHIDAARGIRRAEDDQEIRSGEGLGRRFRQRFAAGEVVAVAKDRTDVGRHAAGRHFPSRQPATRPP
ncbi:MAG: TRAP transporter large permease subunit, partial [Proteobacteria bacterium]|nr:TRAP transporter large permease subunit [Pseudomonadota bacterium]